VILDHKPGAGGDIANAYVSNWNRQETILLLQSSALATNQALSTPRWNTNSLVPLVYMGSMPLVLVVPSNSRISNLKSWRKLSPEQPVTWGSAGIGSSSHMYGEVFKNKIQKNLIHVPYKGISQIIPDLISGNIDAAFVFLSTAEPYIRNNQLIPIAIASGQRSRSLPTIPTFQEAGLSGMDYYSWFILLGNQNNDPAENQLIQRTMLKILSNKVAGLAFQLAGLEIEGRIVDRSFLNEEINRYREIVKLLGLKQ